MAKPGKSAICGATSNKELPLSIIRPKLGTVAGTPKPKKLRVDSIKITPAIPKVACTTSGPAKLGNT